MPGCGTLARDLSIDQRSPAHRIQSIRVDLDLIRTTVNSVSVLMRAKQQRFQPSLEPVTGECVACLWVRVGVCVLVCVGGFEEGGEELELGEPERITHG